MAVGTYILSRGESVTIKEYKITQPLLRLVTANDPKLGKLAQSANFGQFLNLFAEFTCK